MQSLDKKIEWYVTYSPHGPGDVDGFYCPMCFMGMLADIILEHVSYDTIDCEAEANRYECMKCGKDYRKS
jgi:hypothetical protein